MVPGSGMQVTQLGHVADLSDAFARVLGNPKAARQVFNISGERYVTFDGIAKACAKAMGAPEPELVHFNAKDFDFGKAKAFPMRDQHFFASVDKAQELLGWTPQFGLVDGLKARGRRGAHGPTMALPPWWPPALECPAPWAHFSPAAPAPPPGLVRQGLWPRPVPQGARLHARRHGAGQGGQEDHGHGLRAALAAAAQ